jgi:hypothetical protein
MRTARVSRVRCHWTSRSGLCLALRAPFDVNQSFASHARFAR